MKNWKRYAIAVYCGVLALTAMVPAGSVQAAKKATMANVVKLYQEGKYHASQKMSSRLPEAAKEKCVKKMPGKMKKAYMKKVNSFISKSQGHDFYGKSIWDYYLTDIDKDKVPELLIRYGSCEADVQTYVYTYKKGRIKKVGKIYSGHTSCFAYPKKNGLIQMTGHMGYETVRLVTMKNGKLRSKTLGNRDTNQTGSGYMIFPYRLEGYRTYNYNTHEYSWTHSYLV